MRFAISILAICSAAFVATPAEPVLTIQDNDFVSGLAYTPDGKRLVTASTCSDPQFNGRLSRFDATSGKQLPNPTKLKHPAMAVATSPDGKLIAVATSGVFQGAPNRPYLFEQGQLGLVDTETGKIKMGLSAPVHAFDCIAFSPDGKILAAGTNHINDRGLDTAGGTIRLFNTSNGKEIASIVGHKGDVRGVAFSPDGKLLVSASVIIPPNPNQPGSGEVKIWDVATRKQIAMPAAKGVEAWCVAFSPDGAMAASGGADGAIRLWDVKQGKEVAVMKGKKSITTMAFSPDGKTLASGGGESGTPGELTLWDMAMGKEKASLSGHEDSVSAVAFDPKNARLASADARGVIKVWDLAAK